MENNKIDINNFITFVSRISSAIAIITIVCYISGFIIINSYLAKFGITTGELLGSKYLSAGLIYLFFILLFICVFLYIKRFQSHRDKNTYTIKAFYYLKPIMIIASSMIILLLIFSAPLEGFHIEDIIFKNFLVKIYKILVLPIIIGFVLMTVRIFVKSFPKWLDILTYCLLVLFTMFYAVYYSPSFFIIWLLILFLVTFAIYHDFIKNSKSGDSSTGSSEKYISDIPNEFMYILLILATLVIFGRFIYSRIPSSIGGGSPIKVDVYLKEKLSDNIKKSENDTTQYNILSNVYFLHRDQSFLVLFIPDSINGGKAIQINLDQVKLISPKIMHYRK